MSPLGISYIGASKEKLGEAACCAVKRIHLDARIARRAATAGADLKEGFEVRAVLLSLLPLSCLLLFALLTVSLTTIHQHQHHNPPPHTPLPPPLVLPLSNR